MNHYAINIPFLNLNNENTFNHNKMDHSKMKHSKMDHSKMDHSKMDHSKMDYKPIGSNPCTDNLSDIEYLIHMIPHHQVAIDMSNMLTPNTKNPQMLHLCRDIIRKQGYEIWEMTQMKNKLSSTIFDNIPNNVEVFKTKMDIHAPKMSQARDGNCNPLFFKPNDHMKHMIGMDVTDKSYLEHMIPHHQVAIDMSRRLLLHTNHPYLMDFCRKLIIDQQGEIFHMNSLLKNSYNYKSELL
jgi:uncharacterized protein (DUF305 family)